MYVPSVSLLHQEKRFVGRLALGKKNRFQSRVAIIINAWKRKKNLLYYFSAFTHIFCILRFFLYTYLYKFSCLKVPFHAQRAATAIRCYWLKICSRRKINSTIFRFTVVKLNQINSKIWVCFLSLSWLHQSRVK